MKAIPEIASRRSRLESLCRSYRIEILYAFGSRGVEMAGAVDDDRQIGSGKRSDVDIAVKLSAGETLSARAKEELALDLEHILGGGRVDLLALEQADPFLAVNIIRGERLFCTDPFEADQYELYILRRAGDLAPFERMRIDSVIDSPEAR